LPKVRESPDFVLDFGGSSVVGSGLGFEHLDRTSTEPDPGLPDIWKGVCDFSELESGPLNGS